MDLFAVLSPLLVIALIAFLTVRLVCKYCRPSGAASSSSTGDVEAPDDFTRVANHLFVSNTPHTYSRIYVDEASNVRSVTITRIAPPGQHILGYVLDPNALLPIHRRQPPTYEDSIKSSSSPPKYDTTPATTNSTPHNSMELPTSSATTARVDGARATCATTMSTMLMLHHHQNTRSMSDSWLDVVQQCDDGRAEEEGRRSAR